MTWRKRSRQHLRADERDEIGRLLVLGMSFGRIAAALGRPRSTVFREVSRNGGREAYGAAGAEERAAKQAVRPKQEKMARHPELAAEVEACLKLWWSPEQ